MNIGLGLFIIFVSIVFITFGLMFLKSSKKFSRLMLGLGVLLGLIGIFLVTGIYDPYKSHI